MKKSFSIFLIIVLVASIINACRKDESGDQETSGTSNAAQVNVTISGMITDENNQPVVGAQVTTDGLSVSTNHYGIFLLKGKVTKDRCVLNITKTGFTKRLHALIPKENTVNYIRVVLGVEPASQNISAAAGGTISLSTGGSIQFAANSFVINGTTTPYTGTVNVFASDLSPGSANFGLMIPGGDLTGKNAAGDNVSLYSYGMTSATLKGSGGEDLQLAVGTTAIISFPIEPGQQGTAPAAISLWYLDETTALWKEEGQATKNGNNYVGSVSHFTWWNYDYGFGRATITGRVIDCEGTPLSNVTVTVNNQMTVITDQDGHYTNWVPAGIAVTCQVLPQGAISLSSQLENVGLLTDNQVITVPDLNIGCGARIKGQLINCAHENISGNIILKLNNSPVYFGFSETGDFNFFIMPNTNYLLEFETDDGVTSQNITSPAPNVTLEMGTVIVCNDVSSLNGFTIDGDGFNHFEVNIIRDSINHLGYSLNATYANIWGNYSSDTASIQFEIPADEQNHSNTEPTMFSLSVNGVFYGLSINTFNDFILNIDYYGAIGDSIKGTFSGHLYADLNQVPVMITNGRFAGVREH